MACWLDGLKQLRVRLAHAGAAALLVLVGAPQAGALVGLLDLIGGGCCCGGGGGGRGCSVSGGGQRHELRLDWLEQGLLVVIGILGYGHRLAWLAAKLALAVQGHNKLGRRDAMVLLERVKVLPVWNRVRRR